MSARSKLLSGLFWLSGFALIHTYALYPAVLALVSRVVDSPARDLPSELPTVSLVIAAYNEEEVIAEKIKNSLELDYPDNKLEIVVFSDASSDRTDEIVKGYADRGVELVRVEGRVGKTACQNVLADRVESDIIVFSDANSIYDPDAITELVAGFEPGVGCVVGELRYGSDGVEGESAYWRYERLIKRLESSVGSIVTGNGSIYAVRNSAYVPLPDDAISDFAEPLALIENGSRIAYAPTAIAREQTGDSVESELGRRIRIGTRAWNTLDDHSTLLNPLHYPVFSFKLVSHKVLRWLSPLFLLTAFTTSLVLALTAFAPLYVAALSAQLLFYACALLGTLGDRAGVRTPTVFHVPYYFLVSNYGMAYALAKFLQGRNVVTWETADRAPGE
jgi:cellulose synthase/poly-beta-1,6-N-acetylglucosamine synthase-like glycosyltransferase